MHQTISNMWYTRPSNITRVFMWQEGWEKGLHCVHATLTYMKLLMDFTCQLAHDYKL